MPKQNQKLISVIIRTKNEEKWIGHCLDSIFEQEVDAAIEVVLVDNESTDHTLDIVNRYPINKVIKIRNFLPGRALNDGIKASNGDYIVCISAHCIPKSNNWLQIMLNNFTKESGKLAGVYGRQLPLSFTDPIDKRDLLIVFGLDKRIQEKDYFFHNANSMIPRSIWELFPFDEDVTNIEDRVWGKAVIDAGYKIIYEPQAEVYHHHGLHQGNKPERARGVVSILEKIDSNQLNGLPKGMYPENVNTAAVIPIIGNLSKNSKQFNLFKKAVINLKSSKYVKSIYCIVEDQSLCEAVDIKWIDRNSIMKANQLGLDELMKQTLNLIEDQNDFPNNILYINYDYINRPEGIIDELIVDAQLKGCDTVFPGLIDYGHYWFNDEEKFKQTDPSLKFRSQREPLFKALYGLGCLSSTWLIRKGRMVGGKIGILKIEDINFAERNRKK